MAPKMKAKYPNYRYADTAIGTVAQTHAIGTFVDQIINSRFKLTNPETFQITQELIGYKKLGIHTHSGENIEDIQNEKDYQKMQENAGQIIGEMDRFLEHPDAEKYRGLKSFVSFYRTLLNDANNGIDTYDSVLKVDGATKYSILADIDDTDRKTKQMFSIEEFDDCLKGMHYPELLDGLLQRTRLMQEMAQTDMTPEKRKEYTERLIELDTKQVSLLHDQCSEENLKKYGKFYKNPQDTLTGARGIRAAIRGLDHEIQLLKNGWDPATVQDAVVYIKHRDKMRGAAKILEGLHEETYKPLIDVCKEFEELDPLKQTFRSPGEQQAFLDQYAEETARFMQTVSRPEIHQLIQEQETKKVDKEYTFTTLDISEKSQLNGVLLNQYFDPSKLHLTAHLTTEFIFSKSSNHAMNETLAGDIVNEIAKKAQDRLNTFEETLDVQRESNSSYYTDMRASLERVAQLDSYSTPEEIQQSLTEMQKAAETYSQKRAGILKSDQGQSRLDMADSLAKDAADGLEHFRKVSMLSDTIQQHPEKSLISAAMTASREAGDPLNSTERGMTVTFVTKAAKAFKSIHAPMQYLLHDNRDRKNRKVNVSESYKQLTNAVEALAANRDTLNANPEELMQAYRNAIKAADQYTKQHTGARHLFSGNDKKGKNRVVASKMIGDALRKNLAAMEQLYSLLPVYDKKETPFERYADMDRLAPGISKGFVPKSPAKINAYLDDEIGTAQEKLGKMLDQDAPEDETAFQRVKKEASEHITKITAANALKDWVADGRNVPNVKNMLNVMQQKMPLDKPYTAVMHTVQNWDQLQELGEKACTPGAIGLTAELAKHRKPKEIQTQTKNNEKTLERDRIKEKVRGK